MAGYKAARSERLASKVIGMEYAWKPFHGLLHFLRVKLVALPGIHRVTLTYSPHATHVLYGRYNH